MEQKIFGVRKFVVGGERGALDWSGVAFGWLDNLSSPFTVSTFIPRSHNVRASSRKTGLLVEAKWRSAPDFISLFWSALSPPPPAVCHTSRHSSFFHVSFFIHACVPTATFTLLYCFVPIPISLSDAHFPQRPIFSYANSAKGFEEDRGFGGLGVETFFLGGGQWKFCSWNLSARVVIGCWEDAYVVASVRSVCVSFTRRTSTSDADAAASGRCVGWDDRRGRFLLLSLICLRADNSALFYFFIFTYFPATELICSGPVFRATQCRTVLSDMDLSSS